MKNNVDQAEVESEISRLELLAKFLRAELEAQTGEKAQAPQIDDGDALATLDALERHCASLESKLNSQPRRTPGGSAAPAPGSSVFVSSPGVAAPSITPTDRLLAREGVGSLAELAAKKRRERNTPKPRQATGQEIPKNPKLTATEKAREAKANQ